jgi:phosphohistidine phosphatase
MKRLFLFRHAKSAWPEGVADFDRPLAPRGIAAATLMGRFMAKEGHCPARIIVSAARRTQETWSLLKPHIPREAEIAPAVYNASPQALFDLVRADGGREDTLMLVGHNPGMGGLALGLADEASSDADALQRLSEKVPTAALSILDLDIADWRDMRPEMARLVAFVTPRQLGGVDED